jgi:hypothetical protein
MAKKKRPPSKPLSILYEEDLQRLSAELKAAEDERTRLEVQWHEKYLPDIEELIRFAKERKHGWAGHWTATAEAEDATKEMLLSLLYASTHERAKIIKLDYEIKRLKPKVNRAKEMVRFTRGGR